MDAAPTTDEGLVSELKKQGIFVTSVQELYNWGRQNSIWPLQFGLACCAIEMIATAASKYDLARFGGEVFRPSPRQADLIIVAGTVTKKMAPQVIRLYNQMPDPKYVIAMGACAISGGPFKQGYNVLKGSTGSSPSTSTSPAARRVPRRCCTRSWSCSGRSMSNNSPVPARQLTCRPRR
jgi:NADH-quinone oxidoreductase B subunit